MVHAIVDLILVVLNVNIEYNKSKLCLKRKYRFWTKRVSNKIYDFKKTEYIHYFIAMNPFIFL